MLGIKNNKYYSPFGAIMPGRNSNPDQYRYGMQGQEKDDELKNVSGSSINFEYRMYDPRAGRFLSLDPLSKKYPHNSPYAFSENRVIDCRELEGLEAWEVKRQWESGDLEKFQAYSKSELERMNKSGEKMTCKDVALHLIIQYAAANGLPLTLHTEASTISNTDETFNLYEGKPEKGTRSIAKGDVEAFENIVTSFTGVAGLAKNTYSVPVSEAGAGDMYLVTIGGEPLAHTVVIAVPNLDPAKEVVYQASMVGPNNAPTTVTKDNGWVREMNVGTNAGQGNVSRFTVLLEIQKNIQASIDAINEAGEVPEQHPNAPKTPGPPRNE